MPITYVNVGEFKIRGTEGPREIRAFLKKMLNHFMLDYPTIPSADEADPLGPGVISREQLAYDPLRLATVFGFALAAGSTAQGWYEQYCEDHAPPERVRVPPRQWLQSPPAPVYMAGPRAYMTRYPPPNWYMEMNDAFQRRFLNPSETSDVISAITALEQGNRPFNTMLNQYDDLMTQLPISRPLNVQRDDILGKMRPELSRALRMVVDISSPLSTYDVVVRKAREIDNEQHNNHR